MKELVIRFLFGGTIISIFALIGSVLKPKSFAGLFSAAPSVALATLSLTILTESVSHAATEARSMLAGAIALSAYASIVDWVMMRSKMNTFIVTFGSISLWFAVAFVLWCGFLR
jgi:hypothetical protein